MIKINEQEVYKAYLEIDAEQRKELNDLAARIALAVRINDDPEFVQDTIAEFLEQYPQFSKFFVF